MTNYFVTAIGTDSGKSLVSAILCEAFQADYWKPVQAGEPGDSEWVQNLLSNEKSKIHPERYRLTVPASPHAAAKHDQINISLQDFVMPESANRVIVEGAGGCMVPLNDRDLVTDLIAYLKLPVLLVSNLYLGSINHTLLTAAVLKRRNLDVRGIIFNGPHNSESERIIRLHTQWPVLLHVSQEAKVDRKMVMRYAAQFKVSHYGGLE